MPHHPHPAKLCDCSIWFCHSIKRAISKFPGNLSLRTVLPIVLQLVGGVAIVGYLSFRNGQQPINDVAAQLRQEIIWQIQSKLNFYTETAHNINRLNTIAMIQGDVDVARTQGERMF